MSYAKSQKLFVDSKGEKQGRIEREWRLNGSNC